MASRKLGELVANVLIMIPQSLGAMRVFPPGQQPQLLTDHEQHRARPVHQNTDGHHVLGYLQPYHMGSQHPLQPLRVHPSIETLN